jgi:hypothetical protein
VVLCGKLATCVEVASGWFFWTNMRDEDSVMFRLSPPAGEEKTALGWFVAKLDNELESKGFASIRKKVSALSYAALSYPATGGHISVFVLWPAGGDKSSWQIRTLYFRPLLRRIFRSQPPKEAIDRIAGIRERIQRFLLTHDAAQIQWVSAAEAEQMLRQE